MSDYGLDYTRMKFSYISQIPEERIVGETVLSGTEVVYEIDDGRKILYEEIGDKLIRVGRTGLDRVTDEMWKKEFSRRLRKMSSKAGYYLKDLATAVGVSEFTMSAYATGKRIPNACIIQRIADVLNCDVSYLTNFNYLL